MTRSESFRRAAWRRLRKNKGAVFGIVVIIIAVIIGIFAYFISPDPSPYANRIILEIGGEKPGYKQSFIKVKKEKNVESKISFSNPCSSRNAEMQRIPSGT